MYGLNKKGFLLGGRVPSNPNPILARYENIFVVELKRGNSCTPAWSCTDDGQTISTPGKMVKPILNSGIVKGDTLTCGWVDTMRSSTLVTIA